MRHLSRLSIFAATTALTGTTALAGAGLDGAQDSIPWTPDSPSRVTVERGGGTAAFAPTDGASGPVTFVREVEGENGEVVLAPAPSPELSDTSFRPEVVTVCAFSGEGADGFTYAELEKSAGGGGTGAGGVLGSLAGLTAAFGS